jgi:hypothetical protein
MLNSDCSVISPTVFLIMVHETHSKITISWHMYQPCSCNLFERKMKRSLCVSSSIATWLRVAYVRGRVGRAGRSFAAPSLAKPHQTAIRVSFLWVALFDGCIFTHLADGLLRVCIRTELIMEALERAISFLAYADGSTSCDLHCTCLHADYVSALRSVLQLFGNCSCGQCKR